MRWFAVLVGVLLASMVGGGPARAAPTDAGVRVTVDQVGVATAVGDRISVTVRMVNTTDTLTMPLVAHVNVASLDPEVYVDLEDWTTDPTRYVAPLPAGASHTVDFQLHAVNAGTFGVYVVLLPNVAAADGQPASVASPALRVRIEARRPLNASGTLPVAMTVPALLGLGILVGRVRTRR